jgi:hypothetical protein
MPLSNLKPRSDSAIVRNMLTEIEAALAAGASREDVWKTLRDEEGLSSSFQSFAKALMRARQSKQVRSSGAPAGQSSGSVDTDAPPATHFQAQIEANPSDSKNSGAAQDQDKPGTAERPNRPNRIKTEKHFKDVRENTDFTGLDTKYE